MGLCRLRAFVLCVAVAFAGSGFVRAATAGQPCLNHSAAASVHEGHGADHHPDSSKHTKDANMKCCGICISASAAILPAQDETGKIRAARIDYPSKPVHLTGRSVALDPGIPKRCS